MEVKKRRNHLSFEDKKLVVVDYINGMKVKDIREKYRIGKTTLYRIINTLGKPVNS